MPRIVTKRTLDEAVQDHPTVALSVNAWRKRMAREVITTPAILKARFGKNVDPIKPQPGGRYPWYCFDVGKGARVIAMIDWDLETDEEKGIAARTGKVYIREVFPTHDLYDAWNRKRRR